LGYLKGRKEKNKNGQRCVGEGGREGKARQNLQVGHKGGKSCWREGSDQSGVKFKRQQKKLTRKWGKGVPSKGVDQMRGLGPKKKRSILKIVKNKEGRSCSAPLEGF